MISSLFSRLMEASNYRQRGDRTTTAATNDWLEEMTAPGSHTLLNRIERCRTANFSYHAYRSTCQLRCTLPSHGFGQQGVEQKAPASRFLSGLRFGRFWSTPLKY
ncbi:MAG: hypothetical protein WKF89_11665 [Chitinophagaceae bacterium]